MSVPAEGSLWMRITSDRGLTAISHYFVMDFAAVWMDIVGGLVIAGAIAAWVPQDFWQGFFLTDHPVLATLWGPIVGPLVAIISFVCSVGNIPLAAVLWNAGISFGGVVAFILADLIVLPILNIYRVPRTEMARSCSSHFMSRWRALPLLSKYCLASGLFPASIRRASGDRHVELHDVVNIGFLLLAAFLVWRCHDRRPRHAADDRQAGAAIGHITTSTEAFSALSCDIAAASGRITPTCRGGRPIRFVPTALHYVHDAASAEKRVARGDGRGGKRSRHALFPRSWDDCRYAREPP
jgi:hypothetical protein